jgi:hypothetical protein
VIRSLRAVHCDSSAELRDDENRAARPSRTERCAQAVERLIETAQPVRELSTLGALVRVRVPAARFENGDTRPIRRRQEFPGCGGHGTERIERIAPAGAHAAALARDLVRGERGLQPAREVFVRRVQIGDALQSIGIRLGQARRRPRADARSAAQDQRHILRERECDSIGRALLRFRQQRQRAIQPAVVRCLRRGRSVLEQILAVEVRALAIRRCHCVKDDQLPRLEALMQVRERRMQCERPVELELRRRDRERAAFRGVAAITVSRYGGEAVERAAQDHEHEARIGRDVGEQAPRQHRGCAGCESPTNECAAAGHVQIHLR